MRVPKKAVSVRVDAESYSYLRAKYLVEGLSITDTLAGIVRAHEKQAAPVQFRIERWLENTGDNYAVLLSYCTIECSTVSEAKRVIDEIRKEHGLCARRFPICPEVAVKDFRDPPLANDK